MYKYFTISLLAGIFSFATTKVSAKVNYSTAKIFNSLKKSCNKSNPWDPRDKKNREEDDPQAPVVPDLNEEENEE